MRRIDKEITDRKEIESIIRRSSICRLAMCDGDMPYVVPLCFGFEDGRLYFHSAADGRKLEVLRRNGRVCFEVDIDQEIIGPGNSNRSSCSMRYRSVIGFGHASFIDDPLEKRMALDAIMHHYSQKPFAYPEAALVRTAVFKVEIESMTGKKSGDYNYK